METHDADPAGAGTIMASELGAGCRDPVDEVADSGAGIAIAPRSRQCGPRAQG